MNHAESHDPSSLIYSQTVWKRFGDTAGRTCMHLDPQVRLRRPRASRELSWQKRR